MFVFGFHVFHLGGVHVSPNICFMSWVAQLGAKRCTRCRPRPSLRATTHVQQLSQHVHGRRNIRKLQIELFRCLRVFGFLFREEQKNIPMSAFALFLRYTSLKTSSHGANGGFAAYVHMHICPSHGLPNHNTSTEERSAREAGFHASPRRVSCFPFMHFPRSMWGAMR